MPNFKHIVKVKPDEEKRLYRIFKELEKQGESEIKGMDTEWHSTMRKFGIRTKKISGEHGFIDEPWIQRDGINGVKAHLIRVKKDVECVEIPGNNISFFHFKRRRII